MKIFEEENDNFRGHNHGEIPKEDLLNLFRDAIDVISYNRLQHPTTVSKIDSSYTENKSFWSDASNERLFEGKLIELQRFHLTEWLPSAPGRYFTERAIRNRKDAASYYDYDRQEFNVLGKLSMVLGGIGSLRLLAKSVDSSPTHFLGASSSGISHQGIPIAMPEDVYRKAIGAIREFGGCNVDLVGTIKALPVLFESLKFDREIPKYCIFVNNPKDLKIKRDSLSKELLVTVAITFEVSDRKGSKTEEFRELVESKAWSFCSYNPSQGIHGLKESVNWLSDYAKRYSGDDSSAILCDFDEHFDHFPNRVEFPISQVAKGSINERLVKSYANKFGITYIKEVIVGDKFENIGNNVNIINRSIVEKAFNKVKDSHDEVTAVALKRVASEINKSGNKKAAETFNAFSEELQKPKPQKSVLGALWEGVVTALPSIEKLTDVVEKVKILFI